MFPRQRNKKTHQILPLTPSSSNSKRSHNKIKKKGMLATFPRQRNKKTHQIPPLTPLSSNSKRSSNKIKKKGTLAIFPRQRNKKNTPNTTTYPVKFEFQ